MESHFAVKEMPFPVVKADSAMDLIFPLMEARSKAMESRIQMALILFRCFHSPSWSVEMSTSFSPRDPI